MNHLEKQTCTALSRKISNILVIWTMLYKNRINSFFIQILTGEKNTHFHVPHSLLEPRTRQNIVAKIHQTNIFAIMYRKQSKNVSRNYKFEAFASSFRLIPIESMKIMNIFAEQCILFAISFQKVRRVTFSLTWHQQHNIFLN